MTAYPIYFFYEPNIKPEIMLIHLAFIIFTSNVFIGEYLLSLVIVIADSDKSGFFVFFP